MASEGDFEKSDGDVLYATEIRKLYGLGVSTDIGTTAEGTYPKVDGDPLYPSEVNEFIRGWGDLIYIAVADYAGILVHSATDWTAYDSGGTATVITANAGVSWTAANADIADMTGVGEVSGVDSTKSIICDHNALNVSISDDSGNNWASASTNPPGMNFAKDMSFPTATVAVIVGELLAATRGIWYSSDSGDTWAECTSGPAAAGRVVDMVDGSDGIMIDVNKNIWTTSNSGVDWTDSTEDVSQLPGILSSMIALTTTTGILLNNHPDATVETFDTTSGTTIRMQIHDIESGASGLSNLCKITNGNVYFVHYQFTEGGDEPINSTLYRSEDDGITWSARPLGVNHFDAIHNTKTQLVEYDTNKLLILIGNQSLMTIDES